MYAPLLENFAPKNSLKNIQRLITLDTRRLIRKTGSGVLAMDIRPLWLRYQGTVRCIRHLSFATKRLPHLSENGHFPSLTPRVGTIVTENID